MTQLRARVSSLESSNRDTVALLESKSSAYDALGAELAAKHQKTVDLRREVSTLEQTVQTAQSATSSAKFREQGLKQEVESLSRTNEWLDNELKTKSAEHTKYRREKSARIAELQQQNEEAAGSIDGLQRTEQALRTRITELSETVEERLTELQSLREDATGKEEDLRRELDTVTRLNTLYNDSFETERRRGQELSSQLNDAKENAAGEVGRLGAEIETEHQEREAAEQKIAELEVTIDQLRSDLAVISSNTNAHTTPNARLGRSLNGPAGSPAGSRFGSPAPSAMKGSMSYTQLVSDYHSARAELDAEKRRNEKLSSTIDEMMHEMEEHQPAIEELQAEHGRLEAHIVQMSTDLDNASKERDQAKDDAERQGSEVSALVKEGELLRQQLRDLSAQVRVLLLEVNMHKQGSGDLTREERTKLEALARGQEAYENMDGMSETDRIISQQLTTFRNIEDLHSQNERLMRAIRELSTTVESAEYREAGRRAADAERELSELRKQLEQADEKMASMVTMSNSYIQERDMFRRMVLERSQPERGSWAGSPFAESSNGLQFPSTPARNGVMPSIEGSSSADDLANYNKLLKELQAHFDNYKTEAARDRSLLKNENDSLSKKNSELRIDLSKKTGECSLAVERHNMLDGNYVMLKNENVELQKRSQKLSDQAAKQEIRSQQASEDLIETRDLLECMRNETANLKAEKEFWKSVEKRLTNDNGTLVSERDRLNALNASLQTLLNDREHDESDTRRRLQAQIEIMEADLQAARRKLNDETEESKRVASRREYDTQQNQSRIDDLMTRLGSVREELVEAKASRDHLQSKVDEFTIELRSANERVQLLQPRPTSSTAVNGGANAANGPTAGQSQEQKLALEVSDLKRDLDLARGDLANAKTEVDQYKSISRDAEAELASLGETQEQYRNEMDGLLEERNATISSLEKKVEELQTEITTLNGELSEKIQLQADFDRKLEDQRAGLDAEIARLKSDLERTEAASHFHQEDLKAQAQIAQQAQKNYEDELVKHADAAKALSTVRAVCQGLKLEVVELRGSAEAAQTKLSQSEESWAESKDRYENEIREVNSRKGDLVKQNQILHQQLDTLSQQLGELKKRRTSADASELAPVVDEENWQELIKYVRREKEIIEVQFELSSQEAKRLRQQLDHTQSQLEDTRLKLAQQRKAEENSERSALNHKKLMDTINELNLNRESNATLRLEKNELRQALTDKEKAVEDLLAQIQPLNAKLQGLEDLKESQDEELRMTREARERFEQRYLDVLHKSNTIDPAEVDALKQKLSKLETELDALNARQAELQEQATAAQVKLDEGNERWQQNRNKIVEQSKQKAREQNTKIREQDTALQAANAEKVQLDAQLKAAVEQAVQADAEKSQAQAALSDLQSRSTNADVQMTDEQAAAQSTGPSNDAFQDLQGQLELANAKADSAGMQLQSLQDRVATAESRVAELEQQLATERESLEQANSKIATLESQLEATSGQGSGRPAAEAEEGEVQDHEPETVTALLETLRELQAETDELKAQLLVFEHAQYIQVEDRSITDVIAEEVDGIRAELTKRHDERVRQAEELFARRTQQMRSNLNKKLSSVRSETRGTDELGKDEALERLREGHAREISSLKDRHADELQKLKGLADQGAVSKQDTAPAAQPEVPTGNAANLYDLSDDQVKEFLSKNDLARKILNNNIQKRVTEHLAKAKAKSDEEQATAQAKANNDKTQAIEMEAKKWTLKISMTENRFKAAQVKVDVVQKASAETPEKPVGEVWAVAKDAKPEKATPAAASPAPANPFAATKIAQAASRTDTPGSPAHPTQTQSPAAAPSAKSTAPSQLRDAKPLSSSSAAGSAGPSRAGLADSQHAPPGGALGNAFPASSAASTTSNNAPAPSGPANRSASGSGIARGASSGLPVAASARGRGQGPSSARGGASNIGRGRGARATGPARGGSLAGSTTGGAPAGAQGSGSAAGASGGAGLQGQPSVPSKRTREDSGLEGSAHASDPKRPRGGGTFSG